MSTKVIFSCGLNDGGSGHEEEFTLAELGIPEGQTPENLESDITDSYQQWMENFNSGGWELVQDGVDDRGQPEGLFDDYLKSGDEKDLPF